MQYELFNWEHRVKNPVEMRKVTPEVYAKELENIRAAFMAVLLSSEQDTTIERYVRLHQAGILQLSLDLESGTGTSKRKTKDPSPMAACLDDLAIFLERHAARYLDQDMPLPYTRGQYFLSYIRERLPQVKERLQAGGTDQRLSELVLELLRESTQDGHLTYRQWFPLEDLVGFILQLPRVDKGEASVKGDLSVSQRLVETLYRLNVNTTGMYRYIKATIEEVVEDKEYVSGKLPELGRVKRYVHWLEHKPGYQYVAGRVSLARMLSAWLEELGRLKEKEGQKTGDEEKDDESGFGLDSKKVITSLTVNELGLLVRLFMETGVFRTRNRKGLARFMAQNVVTLKKEAVDEVSSNHLYGTLYSMNDATLDSVQAILNRMLVRLGKLRLEQRQKKPAKGKK